MQRVGFAPWQFLVITFWSLAALAAFPRALSVSQELDAAAHLPGSQSENVGAALRLRFGSPFTKIALLRIAASPDPRTPAGRDLLKQTAEAIKSTTGVQGVLCYADYGDELFIAQDGTPILIVGLSDKDEANDPLMDRLRQVTNALGSKIVAQFPNLRFRWTGEAAVNADMRRLSARATRNAELGVLPLTLVLLLVAFRSAVAALLPVLCGVLTVTVSMGILSILNRVWPCSIIVPSIISMVGLGLSIDYALLLVSHYHDALRQGSAKQMAVIEAARQAGRTILISGTAVAIGFGAMWIVPVSEVRSVGIGGLIVTLVAVLVSNTLLPVLLTKLPLRVLGDTYAREHNAAPGRYWRRWATWVARRPLRVLCVAATPMLLLALQAAHMRTDLPRGRWLPESADSVLALHEIDAVARGNFGQIINVLLELPQGRTILDEIGWQTTSKLVRRYARDARIEHVWAITTVLVKPMSGPELLGQIPDAVRKRLVSPDGRALLIQVLPKRDLAPTDAAELVKEIRSEDVSEITGLAGTKLEVGGVPAFNVDYENIVKRSFKVMAALVVCSTLLVLSVAFRSLLIPLKAVLLNLLSVAAAFGSVALVFQSTWGSKLMGLPRPVEGGFPLVPVLVFGIVFGLSMDYEVFLVSRIADGRARGLSDSNALIEGLAGIGRVITFAAAIMVTIFGGFMFGEFVLIKILGFSLGVAILLDATVIRMAIGPALVQIAGRWNWWPRRYAEMP